MVTYAAGATAGGVLSASTIWLLSGIGEVLTDRYRLGVLAALVAVAGLRDVDLLRFPLPENRRLIPQALFRRHPIRAAAQFGFEMGTGVRTYISTTAPYVLAAALVLLAPSYLAAFSCGIGFGIGRGLMILARYGSASRSEWDMKLDQRLPLIHRSASVVTGIAVFAAVIGAP